MQTFFLQIPDISIIAIIVSIGTAIALIISLIFQWREHRQSVNYQYDETLRNTMSDLYNLYKTEDQLKTKDQCELFAIRLLDILAVLAHLKNEGKISAGVLDFVKFDLSIAKGIMEWFDEKNLGQKYEASSQEIWSNLTTYFKENQIETCKPELIPESLKKYDDLA